MEDYKLKVESPCYTKKRIAYIHKTSKGVEYTKYKTVWIPKPEIDLQDYSK